MNLECLSCNSTMIKKNGHIHSEKQNYRCLSCGRQFVLNPKKRSILEEEKAKIKQV